MTLPKNPANKDDLLKTDELSLSSTDLLGLLETVLGRQASFRFKAKGWSMLPSVRDGDTITVSSAKDPDINPGALVVFRCPRTKNIFVHRIIGKSREGYLMKGDSTSNPDGLFPRKSILGVVTKVERGGKNVIWGLGIERHFLAFLSRTRILFLLLEIWQRLPVSLRSFLRHG